MELRVDTENQRNGWRGEERDHAIAALDTDRQLPDISSSRPPHL
jgi:hypothetical protein